MRLTINKITGWMKVLVDGGMISVCIADWIVW